ncbi:uncharacterized protein DUF3788 [Arcticibacter tournemirensis]|uniref:DUF3788 family protein n=1 Tax=Arcticibacter tournemirensis TaxID=699437 RepID=A0A4V1KIC1_9SPHI|nr:DUF3788 family protein [Arcticibacter tournemirensis]KAA8479706.1 DUF3788 family protein [Arcticibacter tournemirensis]RXF70172.1 DUF3788 family protein [Arcticibacter tournemirensis]TQM50266.1 uncharacterized protein DUF3788 [Arcticibacter tournemirensis]
MESQLLREQDVYPSESVIKQALGASYAVFAELEKTITSNTFALVPEWNYYKDGKAWLCKVLYKKKTVFWLSVWPGFFKVSFYFTEKNRDVIPSLSVDMDIKEAFMQAKPIGRLIPLTVNVSRKEQISDLLKLVECKKNLK